MKPRTPLSESNQGAATPAAAASDPQTIQAELTAQKDRYLRLAADFENYKHRTAQESERRAAAPKDALIVELLPVMDNLERALSARSGCAAQLRSGVERTSQQLDRLLRSHGCAPIDVCGQPFDPRWQEAVASPCDPSHPDHMVLEVVQRGCRQGDALLRPAKVVINGLAGSATGAPSDPERREPLNEQMDNERSHP
ncbi:MAG TPA: nucleotide exchange factor GrpE [Methylomirabilota bacterium]|nr:nucleotide exchange factor GrpE [Methylomirabilota bacterium]